MVEPWLPWLHVACPGFLCLFLVNQSPVGHSGKNATKSGGGGD